ncbi:hypothetical protein [Rufibacter sp. LB8]|uniref:hypothetical protein n=1 Tax=Rufibacter sp. LB8 TaxID=2777781 RepID=UPI00178C4C4E|nr:hypothetical protein [Rufibacter sp. LB8]
MAEINIEPKKRSGWGWLLVLLALLVIGWLVYKYVLNADGGDPAVTNAPAPAMILSVAPFLHL